MICASLNKQTNSLHCWQMLFTPIEVWLGQTKLQKTVDCQ